MSKSVGGAGPPLLVLGGGGISTASANGAMSEFENASALEHYGRRRRVGKTLEGQ